MICGKCVDKLRIVEQKCPMCTKRSKGGLTHDKCIKNDGLDGLCIQYDFSDELVSKIIRSAKYAGEWGLLIELFEKVKFKIPFDVDALIPVPSSREGYRERGFNQAKILCLLLTKITKIPTMDLVAKKINTRKLALVKTAFEREELIKGVFKIKNTMSLNNKRILIVDDVFTSGATMREIARVLKKAGALKVYGWGLASG